MDTRNDDDVEMTPRSLFFGICFFITTFIVMPLHVVGRGIGKSVFVSVEGLIITTILVFVFSLLAIATMRKKQ